MAGLCICLILRFVENRRYMTRFLPTTLCLLALALGESACLFRTRTVEPRTSTAKLETATKDQLVDYLNSEAAKIQTLNATVDIAASVGGEKKGKVTEYQEIRGYILVRKPNMLRMIGLFPIVRNKAFDMVSDGTTFKLSIPSKNKFYIGHNNVVQSATNPLENIRPEVIYEALLLPDLNPQTDITVLQQGQEEVYDTKKKRTLQQPDYIVDVIHRGGNGWYLARQIVFDRTNLSVHQQLIFDDNGAVATEATYQVYNDYNGVSFPRVIEIKRPQEEYSIRLTVDKAVINEPLRDDQFALQQPPGSQLINLDQPNQAASGQSSSMASDQRQGSPAKN
jgi:outer membrane lipoprotein-sorting protein